jgi:VanZ family protein
LIKFLKYNIWGISWGLFIILLTVLPGKVFPKLPEFTDLLQPDKVIHLLIFAVFIYLLIKGFLASEHLPWLSTYAVLIALLLGFLLGAGTELIQHFLVPMRRGSVFDFLANMAGCGLGYWVVRKWL